MEEQLKYGIFYWGNAYMLKKGKVQNYDTTNTAKKKKKSYT